MRLTASPPTGLVDEPTRVLVHGARPGGRVTLGARTHDDGGAPWSSEAVFEADADGVVDPSRSAPVSGSYAGCEPTGLVWSMRREGHEAHDPFSKYGAGPVVIEFSAHAEDGTIASAVVHRDLAGPGVERVELDELDEPGVVAVAFRPVGEGPFPGVLVISGTGGAVLEGTAALLASRGFATVAMAYFGREGLPQQSADIPIEYFRRGLDWLVDRKWARSGAFGVFSTSKGAEAAVLLAAHYPDVTAVVGYNPSGVAYEAMSLHSADGAPWTVGGRPVPYLSVELDFEQPARATLADPYASTPTFRKALEDTEAVRRASLPVEATDGPLLLITGTDDQVWPATAQADLVVARLVEHSLEERVTHLAFADAGHVLGVPCLPTTGSVTTRGGIIRALGGRPECNARAEADGWAAVLSFFAANL